MSRNDMRQDCEKCGEFALCDKDGICAQCRLEEQDETAEETEKEEAKKV
jgi:hypothetical protein